MDKLTVYNINSRCVTKYFRGEIVSHREWDDVSLQFENHVLVNGSVKDEFTKIVFDSSTAHALNIDAKERVLYINSNEQGSEKVLFLEMKPEKVAR